MNSVPGASPGGPAQSVAKRRRLAALDGALAGRSGNPSSAPAKAKSPAAAPQQRPGSAGRGQGKTQGGTEEGRGFPYNPLDDLVMDGALTAVLSQVQGPKLTTQPRSKFPTSGLYGAAAAGDGGSTSSVEPGAGGALGGAARELLSQLVATNPRRGVTDATALVTERLTDRSVLLDNPVARVKLNNLFLRRTSNWSDGLLSGGRRRARRRQRQLEEEQQQQEQGQQQQQPAEKEGQGMQQDEEQLQQGQQQVGGGAGSTSCPAVPPRPQMSFAAALDVHVMWQAYARGVVRGVLAGNGQGTAAQQQLQQAVMAGPPVAGGGDTTLERLQRLLEVHGCLLTVVRHVNPQYVGARGVVVRYSASVLELIERSNRRRVIPIKGCVGEYTVSGITLQLVG